MTTTDPIDRAAQALRAETLGRHGRTESFSTPQDYVPSVRAVFASIDRDGLARAMDPEAFDDHPIEERRPAAAIQWSARRRIALDHATNALAWLTGGEPHA